MSDEDDATARDRLLWWTATGLLVTISLEGILWALTRVFVLNFDIAGPNATMLLVVLLATGWSLAVLAQTYPSPSLVYAACGGLLVASFLGSLATEPLVAGLGAVAMVTAATPPLAGFCRALRAEVAGGAALGLLLFAGSRVLLVTASPYATTLGTTLLGGMVVGTAGLLGGLAATDRLPRTDWAAVGAGSAPLFVLLLVGAGYLAQPWTVARWALRPYWLTVGAFVGGVVAGPVVIAGRGVPEGRELLAWGVLFLAAVATLLWGTHALTGLALVPAWASALVVLAGGVSVSSPASRLTDSNVPTVTGLQLLALLVLFLSTAATHWAFLPAPLDQTRGLGTVMLFALHVVFLLAIALHMWQSPTSEVDAVDRSRRSLLGAVPAALVPLGGLLARRRDPGVEGPRDGSRLRVMTLNLHAFFGEGGEGYNLDAAADLIEADGADVVAVCESDGLRPTVGHVDGLRWLGSRLGYHTAFGAATRQRSYGVGLLSRWPIEDVEVLELPIERSLTRVAVVATVQTPAGPLPVVSTHLSVGEDSGDEDARAAQVRRIVDRASQFERAVLMGDFNVTPARPEYERLTAAFTDAWVAATQRSGTRETLSPSDPRERIDYVFLRGEWTVHEAATKGGSRVSDHRAVVAEISTESLDEEETTEG